MKERHLKKDVSRKRKEKSLHFFEIAELSRSVSGNLVVLNMYVFTPHDNG